MAVSGIGGGGQASWYTATIARQTTAAPVTANVAEALVGSSKGSSGSAPSQSSSSVTTGSGGHFSAAQIQSLQSFIAGRTGGHGGGHHHGSGSGDANATSAVSASQMLDQLMGASPGVSETAQEPMTMSGAS